MENLKHTKAPWFACCTKSKPHFVFANECETTICGIYQKQDSGNELQLEEVQANAKLIAAAPELLEALIEVNDFLSHIQPKIGQYAFDTIDEIVTNAINKATK